MIPKKFCQACSVKKSCQNDLLPNAEFIDIETLIKNEKPPYISAVEDLLSDTKRLDAS